jgi:hypothetical protein
MGSFELTKFLMPNFFPPFWGLIVGHKSREKGAQLFIEVYRLLYRLSSSQKDRRSGAQLTQNKRNWRPLGLISQRTTHCHCQWPNI